MKSREDSNQTNQEIILDELENSKQENDEENFNNKTEFEYNFGWNRYSETTNGRFAMIGILAIFLIELLNKQPFLQWAGILN